MSAKKNGQISQSEAALDPRLGALGLSNPFAESLTAYRPEGIQSAELVDLLLRGLARGDDHPLEGMISTVADELAAFGAVVGDDDPAMGTLIEGWAVRLRVAAELARRYRNAEPLASAPVARPRKRRAVKA